jgi:hypothetical protein
LTDTPKHIKNLQLQLWLNKTYEQRLLQFLTENEMMWNALKNAKKQMKIENVNPANNSMAAKNKEKG